ncbi:MFS transporter [Azotobacter vinelandii]
MRSGTSTVWSDAALRQLYGLITAAVLVIMPSFTLVPLLVKAHFGGGPTQVALIESLGGIGMVAGGILVAAVAPRRRIPWVLWGFALSCFALALTALPSGGMFWLAVLFWVVSSITYALGNAPFTAILQTRVPNHLQGRVLSLLTTLMGLAAPVGLAIATPLGEAIGTRWLFVLLGTVGGLVMLLGFLSPAIRRVDDQTVLR